MEEQNNQLKKESDEIISQNPDEIESLSDNLELDDESLEKIAGGGWGCTKTKTSTTTIEAEVNL